ncbi:hypothetical protein EVAR_38028_1 [Eumeta japonica]|uniref:Uncharacterized protein n=1 Tax=Eumeta variegata TaxID=151549 RepID=A0A4C1WAV4_EUMVA|nr:hypothetical protein EVAR_38028_1 [Eumeta japonica]
MLPKLFTALTPIDSARCANESRSSMTTPSTVAAETARIESPPILTVGGLCSLPLTVMEQYLAGDNPNRLAASSSLHLRQYHRPPRNVEHATDVEKHALNIFLSRVTGHPRSTIEGGPGRSACSEPMNRELNDRAVRFRIGRRPAIPFWENEQATTFHTPGKTPSLTHLSYTLINFGCAARRTCFTNPSKPGAVWGKGPTILPSSPLTNGAASLPDGIIAATTCIRLWVRRVPIRIIVRAQCTEHRGYGSFGVTSVALG